MAEMALQDIKIFYVEDDPKNRTIVQFILESVGAKMEFDKWGIPETMAMKLQRYHPDLILLDLMFPNQTSGYDVFDAIRRYPQFATIPIVAISAADPNIEIPKAREKGFSGFIAKPLDIRLFPQQIASVLKGENVWYSA